MILYLFDDAMALGTIAWYEWHDGMILYQSKMWLVAETLVMSLIFDLWHDPYHLLIADVVVYSNTSTF